MRWTHTPKDPREWRKIFLFLPRRIGSKIVWLERVETRMIKWIPPGMGGGPQKIYEYQTLEKGTGRLWGTR